MTTDNQKQLDDTKILSMEEFLDEKDEEFATIPGFRPGTSLRIGSLTAGDLIEWSEANEGEAKKTAGLRLVIKSLVDKDGKRIGRLDQMQQLRGKSHKVVESIVKEILKLNGMNVKGEKEAKND